MPFVEDPARFSKSRLKSDLVAHNVALPPAASKKDVYVELHLKHIERNQTADFSSDEEEEQERNVAEDEKLPDPRSLTDDELRGALLRYGVKAGPIVASTRSVYENKLRKLLQPDGRVELNGADDAVLYSDSEEDIQEHGVQDDEESGSEEDLLIVELTKNAHQKSKQAELFYQSGEYSYPQCFLPSTRLCVHPSRNTKSAPSRNSRTAKKPSEERSSHCSQIPRDFSRAASVDQCSGLGLGMECRSPHSPSSDAKEEFNGSNEQERWTRFNRLDQPIVDKYRMKDQTLFYTPEAPSRQRDKELPQKRVNEVLEDIYKDAEKTPTGMSVTRRRPIKGAAQRPVEFQYPDTPVSPMTFARREVERRLVPIHIQIVFYVFLVGILYLVYVNVDESSFDKLKDRLRLIQWSGSDETHSLQLEMDVIDVAYGQE